MEGAVKWSGRSATEGQSEKMFCVRAVLVDLFFLKIKKILIMSLQSIAHIEEILDRIFIHLDTPTLVQKIQLISKQWYRVADQHINYNKST
jgi:uncharacterized ferritin-like protein (DUF455 family)